ncbi:hypothetical protein P152DRAFT_454369 [Eremomyces bilateralis CBS 781.70]|uniref:F-box domain-containing protein n=1 Tax=Eremomyces bilateralis CBS 781.70 TaxID=1392243 RepID=A0A6G1GE38_9PEZI|nr:uncharacterized protein P152DRAFT_454369 [Eremomyces bilateralis CBS 781.70]KAF1816129.1 hypothetical protein P152DRAFT_454369 [Eremomyces bilateralis CBS 781.70]
MPTLLFLPTELLIKVIRDIDHQDPEVPAPVLAVRLACRKFRDICWMPETFPNMFFQNIIFMLSYDSLKELIDISATQFSDLP